ncbi:hypothetical protein [Kibdelosporangium phytohabitans]|uniref:Uncharacterized protein n=1 Tax=Kibdelosporangium phytohabitans TaxID=860235 RepID=A0A0N9I3E1_9PSEU|nr:hypothetical protein [Kibdelosporangium phytohabitans]ALG08779.1 hypothetical protein AOZ06_19320 [Kibdelosporangium phytohabitans]MBE1470094.1 hypothetical protein [Kibdelosporangium phytohabitans]
MTNETTHESANGTGRQRMPGKLKLAMGILVFQALSNGFLGYLIIDAVTGWGRTSNSGLLYFVGFLSIGIALVLLGCVLMAGTRQRWIRPTVIGIEVLGLIGGVINLFSGQVTAFVGIGLAIGVLSMFGRDDIREWFSE